MDIFTHSMHVRDLSIQIGKSLMLNELDIIDLGISSTLHDIGKNRIPKKILNKKSPLTKKEREIIRTHPAEGADILKEIGYQDKIIEIVLHHHEWYNGRGYPDGLCKEAIPLLSRVLTIADTYDAMVSVRPYKPGLSHNVAVNEIRRNSGIQFDPVIVEAFMNILKSKSVNCNIFCNAL